MGGAPGLSHGVDIELVEEGLVVAIVGGLSDGSHVGCSYSSWGAIWAEAVSEGRNLEVDMSLAGKTMLDSHEL